MPNQDNSKNQKKIKENNNEEKKEDDDTGGVKLDIQQDIKNKKKKCC